MKNLWRLSLLCFLLFFIPQNNLWAQMQDWGGSIGITLNLGSILNRVGVSGNIYYYYEGFQANLRMAGQYNVQSFGPPVSGFEWQSGLGVVWAWGKCDTMENPFLSPIGNQTRKRYSLAYAYNVYIDQIQTSQVSGTIGIQLNRFSIITENDLLAKAFRDRFRTGAFAIGYRLEDTQLMLSSVLWTGETAHTPKVKNTAYPANYGYIDMEKSLYGGYSHGLLSVQVQHRLPYRQIAQANLGVDAERVRHFIQNQVMHDMYFVPKKWNKAQNLHIPMVDRSAKPYLFQPPQRIKPIKLFLNVGMNENIFY